MNIKSTEEVKSERIACRITEEQKDFLKEMVEADGLRSMSEAVQVLIEAAIKNCKF